MSNSNHIQASQNGSRGNRPSLTKLILVGAALGFAWALFFGEYGTWVKWIGDAYVGLLQMTVLPYVAVSLTANVGRLSAGQGGRLARIASNVLLLLWGIGLLVTGVMSLSFPSWKAGSFFSSSLVEEPERLNWLELFIPSNPFWSLTHNLVPAVVLFSIGLGAALMRVPDKEILLDKLDVLIEGLARLNKMVVRLSPIGIFAIVGHVAATVPLEQFILLQGYLVVYGAAALMVSLWLLPALVASCTPVSHRDMLNAASGTLITAFVIGNTFIVLPLIVDAVKRLMEQYRLDTKNSVHVPEYFVPLAYPFPDIGRIVGLVFIPFAAWFYGLTIDPAAYPQLIGVGFLGAFAKPVVSTPLLLNLAELPSDIFNLYLAVGVVTSRFGDVMKAMHLLAFSILTACALSGAVRLNWWRLLARGLSTAALLGMSVLSIRQFLEFSFEESYSKGQLAVARPLKGTPVEATVLQRSLPNSEPIAMGEDRIDRIRRQGVIRIGIDADELPFSFYNQDGQLVGFDVDMAHQLARDLGVGIEFVPFSADVAELLKADHFDVAMSGLEGTVKRAARLPHMDPYMDVTLALVVPDHRRSEFRSLEGLQRQAGLKMAVIAESAASEFPADLVPELEIIELTSESQFFESQPPVADILATSAEAGSAWTLEYPQFTVVKPQGLDVRVPLYYFVADESQFEEFMENWLALKRRDGTIRRLYDYWILGQDDEPPPPRWCIIRDVLHWAR